MGLINFAIEVIIDGFSACVYYLQVLHEEFIDQPGVHQQHGHVLLYVYVYQ